MGDFDMTKIVILFVLLKLTSAVMLGFFTENEICNDKDYKSSIIEETKIHFQDSSQKEMASLAVER